MFRSIDDGAVRTLTIDNPTRRNAIASDEWGTLAEVIEAFEASDARVLVVRGEGEDFCSGLDVGSAGVAGSDDRRHTAMGDVGRAARALFSITKPTIAAVDGVAAGAGMNLALGADLLIASDRARFTEVFVRRGLTIDFGGSWILPRRVGLARAKELALTGRVITADEALEYGIATSVVPAADLHRAAGELARELALGAPRAQQFIKASLNRSFEHSFEQALAFEAQAQALLFATEDAAEGLASFLQKRPPDFTGR